MSGSIGSRAHHQTLKAAQQRQKAGLPELPEHAKIRRLRGEHLAYLEAQQKD